MLENVRSHPTSLLQLDFSYGQGIDINTFKTCIIKNEDYLQYAVLSKLLAISHRQV